MTTTTTGVTLPEWLRDALDWVGLRWPEGSISGLNSAADAWSALAGSLRQQATDAGVAARALWQTQQGEFAENFSAWWRADLGPGANLTRAAGAADNIAAALRGMAAQVFWLTATWIAQLVALATAVGAVVTGTGGVGGLAIGAGSSAILALVRRAMIRALRSAIQSVVTVIVGQLLFQAEQDLKPVAVPAPTDETKRDPDPEPEPRRPPPPPPPLPPWDPNQRPRCRVNPNVTSLPGPVFTGNLPVDPRYAGNGLIRIDGQVLDGGARQVTIDGFIEDPARDANGDVIRQGYEKDLSRYQLATDIGVPGYQASHLWAPVFGSEAAAGIYLAPAEVNLSLQKLSENYITAMHDPNDPDSWVELRAVATTHDSSVWNNTGANLLASTDYEATLCRANQVVVTQRWSVEVGPPTMTPNGVFQPGRATFHAW